jgi:hypothetical protein
LPGGSHIRISREESTSMVRTLSMLAALVLAAATLAVCVADDPSRQAAVRERSADVMPFDLSATTHVFTKTPTGGVQRVITTDPSDSKQAQLVRAHLTDVAQRFSHGDFSDPTHVHGAGMPGLAALKTNDSRDLHVKYRDVPAGGEIEYSSDRQPIITALHDWFDAQVADHGHDAMMGHDHTMSH